MGKVPPDLCRKKLRNIFKKHLKVSYGQSSLALESRLKSATNRALHSFSEVDRQALVDDAGIAWLDEKLPFFCSGILDPSETLVSAPPAVPVDDQAGRRPRSVWAKGFDFYCYLHAEEIEAELKRRRDKGQMKYGSTGVLCRRLGYPMWKKLSPKDRQIYGSHAQNVEFVRRRNAAGYFERVPRPIAEFADGDEEAHEPVIETPKKQKAQDRTEKALMLELSRDLNDQTPEKQYARKLITKVIDAVPAAKRRLRQHGILHRALRRKQGRPKGSVAVSDEKLIESLQIYHAPVPDLHKSGVEIRTLDRSKTRAARATGLLKRSQFCMRLRLCALGFRGAQCQRGRCDACTAWQAGGRKKLAKLIGLIRSEACRLLPAYWKAWDTGPCLDFDVYELEPCDDVEYMKQMCEYVKHHQHDMKEMRSSWPAEKALGLTGLGVHFVSEVEGLMEIAAQYVLAFTA